MSKYFFAICILIPLLSFSQIEVTITKITPDSATIEFPSNMVIEKGKTYDFSFKTDITSADSIKEGFTYKYLYDGMTVSKSFTHYEQGFNLISKNRNLIKNSFDIGKTMFYIKGTSKWIVSIDGKNISRYNPNDISPTSAIDIEIQSDVADLKKAKYDDNVIVFWIENKEIYRKFKFTGNKLHIELKDLGPFLADLKVGCYQHLVIQLPQVTVKGKTLFGEMPDERMYIMRYVH